MRIALINQFFWPDEAATSQLLTDLARDLARRGHEVHALCADTGYGTANEAAEPLPGVTIHRVRTVAFARSSVARLSSYASFLFGAAYKLLTIPRPDVVLTLTTPPLLSLIGNAAKLLRGSRHFIWEMDLYPDIAIDLGHFAADGAFDRVVGFIVDHSRRYADGMIALGECMRDRLIQRGVPTESICVVHNWADGTAIRPKPFHDENHPLTVLYSGNLGLAHDIETTFGAIVALQHDKDIRFRFAGSGARRALLAQMLNEADIHSVEFAPYANRVSLGESLNACDIGLVTQRNECSGSIVPSKVYGLLAVGRPILYVGPADATPARIIREFTCGWHIECGDVTAMTALLKHLNAHRDEIAVAGTRARQALEQHFDKPLGTARIASFLGLTQPLPSAYDVLAEPAGALHTERP